MFLWEFITCCVIAVFTLIIVFIILGTVRAEIINPTPKMNDKCKVEFSDVIEQQFGVEIKE